MMHVPTRASLQSRYLAVIASAVLSGASLLAFPSVVLAVCSPGRNAGADRLAWAGVNTSPGATPVYVRTTLLEKDVYVHSNVSAWTMLARGSNKWAQVGWWHNAGSPRQMFVQYTKDSGSPAWTTLTYPAKSLGTWTKYEVRRITGGFSFLAAGTTLKTVTDTTFVPLDAQWFGETHNNADQMPGGSLSREEFNLSQISHDLRTWTDVAAAPWTTFSTIYGIQKVSSGDYRIWDKACTS